MALWWTVGGAVVFLALMLYVPFLARLFSFSVMHWQDVAIAFVAAVALGPLVRGLQGTSAAASRGPTSS